MLKDRCEEATDSAAASVGSSAPACGVASYAALPATFPHNWNNILKDAHTYMDYSIQETLATVSKAFTPELVLFRYKELPFFPK